MAEKRISFRDPIWLIPMVILGLVCSIQTLHLTQHNRYCKSDAEWKQIYQQRADDNMDEDDS